jgi:two-component system nitrogen regulation response regulator GlnG/two-component system response regulator HydG
MLPSESLSDNETTRSSSGTEPTGNSLSEPLVTALVIAWCREEPDRIGELAVVPSSGRELVLGRGATDDEPRMRFFRPRPGRLEATPPLSARGLSRRQVEIEPHEKRIRVRRVGRCPMRINGVECEEGVIGWGDTLSFRQELVLLCVRRPACPAPLRYLRRVDGDAFGAADSLGMLGESPAAWLLRDELAFAAQSHRHVLLLGESGTGKELAARAIHRLSARAGRPLVARNAATLPATLIDAEMFGNLKNYPNPGMTDRPGLVGQADGGFLFLDEIGELDASLQSHLLRVLDSGGEYQRLGESVSRRSDFRLLAATNRDPTDVRADLVARFAIRVEVPPLSERREDIPLLLRHLVQRAADTSPELAKRFVATAHDGTSNTRIDAKLVDVLVRRDYPGNVRELEAQLWKAMAASADDVVAYHDSTFPRGSAAGSADGAAGRARNREPSEGEIREALSKTGSNVARAAKELGLSRYALYRRIVKLGIDSGG